MPGGALRVMASLIVLLAVLVSLLGVWAFVHYLKRRHLDRLSQIAAVTEELRAIARGELEQLSRSPRELGAVGASFEQLAQSIQRQRSIREEQKAILSGILNGMGEGVLAVDSRKRIVLANDRFCFLLGISKPRSGEPFYEVARHASLSEGFEHGLRGEPWVNRAVLRVGLVERQVEIRVFPVRGASEVAAVALVIDMTELERLLRIRRDFIADFSHEARTPLAGIRSSFETLDRPGLGADQKHQLERIIARQLERLERLVSDLAELNSIETGEIELRREPTAMLQILQDLSEAFAERAGARGISIVVEGDASTALVDPIRIDQVFANLLDNAIRHAPDSDEVRVEVLDRELETEVRVSDRGPGIPEEDRERIFHRFHRTDRSRSSDTAGTGLGLAITKHLVLRHGGSIRAESTPGQGATFIVTLPKE
jgi:signal transduction histidine kinase